MSDRTILAELVDLRVVQVGRALLDELSLQVHAGELLAIVGPNSAGKSTARTVLAGDLHPDSERVLIDGEDLSSWDPERLARFRAVMPQNSQLASPYPVNEVIRRKGCAQR